MADTATKQNDTTPKPAAAKRTTKPRAKTAAKSRRSTARKPRTATKATPRTQPTATTTAPRSARQVFAGAIDAQEKTLTAFADYQTRAAELTQIPGAAAIAGAQAQLLRGATDAYVSAARSLLK